MYAVIQLIQANDRQLTVHTCPDEKSARDTFEKLAESDSCSEIPVDELKYFKWLWERRSHAKFIWIVPIKDGVFNFGVGNEFLSNFETNGVLVTPKNSDSD